MHFVELKEHSSKEEGKGGEASAHNGSAFALK